MSAIGRKGNTSSLAGHQRQISAPKLRSMGRRAGNKGMGKTKERSGSYCWALLCCLMSVPLDLLSLAIPTASSEPYL